MWWINFLLWLTTHKRLLYHSLFQKKTWFHLSCLFHLHSRHDLVFVITLAAGGVLLWSSKPSVVPVVWFFGILQFLVIFSSAADNLVWISVISLHNWAFVFVSVIMVVYMLFLRLLVVQLRPRTMHCIGCTLQNFPCLIVCSILPGKPSSVNPSGPGAQLWSTF